MKAVLHMPGCSLDSHTPPSCTKDFATCDQDRVLGDALPAVIKSCRRPEAGVPAVEVGAASLHYRNRDGGSFRTGAHTPLQQARTHACAHPPTQTHIHAHTHMHTLQLTQHTLAQLTPTSGQPASACCSLMLAGSLLRGAGHWGACSCGSWSWPLPLPPSCCCNLRCGAAAGVLAVAELQWRWRMGVRRLCTAALTAWWWCAAEVVALLLLCGGRGAGWAAGGPSCSAARKLGPFPPATSSIAARCRSGCRCACRANACGDRPSSCLAAAALAPACAWCVMGGSERC